MHPFLPFLVIPSPLPVLPSLFSHSPRPSYASAAAVSAVGFYVDVFCSTWRTIILRRGEPSKYYYSNPFFCRRLPPPPFRYDCRHRVPTGARRTVCGAISADAISIKSGRRAAGLQKKPARRAGRRTGGLAAGRSNRTEGKLRAWTLTFSARTVLVLHRPPSTYLDVIMTLLSDN